MNTIRSTYIGWGALIVAGGGAYFFAKRSIDADKRTKYEALRKKKQRDAEVEEFAVIRSGNVQPPTTQTKNRYSPSNEASDDPVPTNHQGKGNGPRSKYEPAIPYQSPRGDRFT